MYIPREIAEHFIFKYVPVNKNNYCNYKNIKKSKKQFD